MALKPEQIGNGGRIRCRGSWRRTRKDVKRALRRWRRRQADPQQRARYKGWAW